MRARRYRMARSALLVLGLAVPGCASWLGPPRLRDCPGPLVSTDMIPAGNFTLRERVRIAGEGVSLGLELVAERRGAELVVIGFNAFGAKAFALTQRGLEVEIQSSLGRALPVTPLNVLRDLHAARFARDDAPPHVEVTRPGCHHTATFVTISRTELP